MTATSRADEPARAPGPVGPSRSPGPVEDIVPIAVAAAPRTDTSDEALRVAIHDDLVRSALRRRTIPGERVLRTAEVVGYRCDLLSVEVNAVVAARFEPGEAADQGIERTIDLFDGRPFLWWVGEDDTPADLSERLGRRGVVFLDDIPGMAMDLADLAPQAGPAPDGLEVEAVLGEAAMAAFHSVLVQGFPEDFVDGGPVDAAIGASSIRTAIETHYREPNGLPTRWIGRVDGVPVTTTRLHTAAGVAGIYAVVTAESARRRGYGEAITRRVLEVARDAGLRIAVLQASPAGRRVYERIGFRERCRLRLHEWQPAAAR